MYALALDPLLAKIQSDGRIKGIVTRTERRLKTVAHADDMYVLLRDEEELQALKKVLMAYGEASGAVINEQKSKCYFLNADNPDIVCQPMDMGGNRGQGQVAQQTVRSIKILGINFGLCQDIWEQEWKTWASKVEVKLQKGKNWKLHIFQRVRYFNIDCIPMALSLAVVYLPPRAVIEAVTGQLFHFVWGTKFFPLSRTVAYKKIKEGGLGAWAHLPCNVSVL